MGSIILASGLDGKEHLEAFDALFEARFAALELEKILIYMVDTVDSKALPYLAQQFDLLGLKGWNAAKTDQDRRNLIKRAIELKRYQGTNYAIIRAVQSVGYYDAEVIEGVQAFYDGRFKHDGLIKYGAGKWACFAVILDIGEGKGISESETQEAIDLINEYKNARSKLMWVGYKCTLIDTVQVSEDFTFQIEAQNIDTVDPINDNLDLVGTVDTLIDTLATFEDGGLTINFVNSQNQIISTESI